jgi:hypothetical protein
MNKVVWRLMRSLLFLVIGLMNTVFISSELIGSFEYYIGYALLLLAGMDVTSLAYEKYKSKSNYE